jgi:peroxiredoxin family protein
LSSSEATNAKTMAIIVTKGTLDWAYPPFILATTAAATVVDVTMFFTACRSF